MDLKPFFIPPYEGLTKTLRIVKLTVFILVAACLQSAASGHAQKITLSEKNVSLEKVFSSIEKQSGYVFFFDCSWLEKAGKVTIDVKDASLDKALDIFFSQQPLTYSIVGSNIIVKPKINRIIQSNQVFPPALPIDLTGKVSDATGKPMEGVSVTVVGKKSGVSTDQDGNFRITVEENAVLRFSYIGFETIDVQVRNKTNIEVKMMASTSSLNDVVVVGYGAQKRKDLTGSISSLNASVYKDQPVLNAAGALQGRVAGVSVTNVSGAPGGKSKIRIRGPNSITANNDPLYVLDGVALSSIGLQDININDIESMEILKDASATAIYGSRGANGVILVTTKSGKAGAIKVDYNGFVSGNQPMHKYKLLNAEDYATQANHIAGNTVFDPSSFAGKGTDWQDQLFRTGITQNHQLAISGGTDKSRYYISGYYVNQTGILVNTNQKKFAIRSNIDTKISEKITVGLKLFAGRTNSKNIDDQGYKGNPVMSSLAWAPTEPVYSSPGMYNRTAVSPIWSNPYMTAMERDANTFSNTAALNGKIRYTITDYLTLDVVLGVNLRIDKLANLTNQWINPLSQGSSQSMAESYTFQNSDILTFHKVFNNKHDLTAMGLVESNTNKYYGFNATGSGLMSTSNGYYNLALNSSQSIGSAYSNWALLSYVGRIAYSYNNKYLLNAALRADGSSKFQTTTNRWEYFPSIGLGWRMSEEDLIKKMNVFSNLKLRGSFGITGSQAIGPYGSLGLLSGVRYSFGTNVLSQGYTLGSPDNPNLSWETTRQMDIGLDIGFLDNRINVTLDYYNKRTKDLLLQTPIAGYDGGGTFLKNIGVVSNKGVELSLDIIPVQTDNFSWTTTFNASAYSNKVISVGKDSILYRSIIGEGLISTNLQVVKKGEAFGAFYLIPWRGVYRTDDPALGFKAGDNSYQDTNGDGQIGFDDRVIVGSALPKFLWGWNNNFRFRNIELNLFIQSALGNKVFNATYAGIAASTSDVYYPTLKESSNYWTPQNTSAPWADPATKTGRSYVESTRNLQDGSYVRLKNISISYTLPRKTSRLPEIKWYVSGQNLVTITKYKGFDPEASSTSESDIDAGIDLGAYPSPRIITFGVHLVL